MSKTGLSIESDIYSLVKSSAIKTTILGNVYRSEMRPPDAETEDAVVTFLTGTSGSIQSGVLVVTVFVPYMQSSGSKVKDIERCTVIENVLDAFIHSLTVYENYKFELEETVQTFKVQNIEQSAVNCRIKFSLSNY